MSVAILVGNSQEKGIMHTFFAIANTRRLQSPERLEARLKELQIAVDKERVLTTEAERRSRDLQNKLETIAKASGSSPKHFFFLCNFIYVQ